MDKFLIGSHVSMAGERMLVGSVEDALSYGSNTFMIYTGAPQNTRRKEISALKIDEAKKLMKENNIDINNIVIHAPYIINLANTTKPRVSNLAKDFLLKELDRTSKIGAKYIVLHPGSHVGAGIEKGSQQIIDGLNEVLEKDKSDVMILLETMSGKGSEVGFKFEQLKYIMDNVTKRDRLGICLDTCHINDAGYDIINSLDDVINEFDNIIGIDNLKVIHLNDSKNEIGDKKDRHANIGEGSLGLKTIENVINHPKLREKIFILETPFKDGVPPYKEEIELLKKLYN